MSALIQQIKAARRVSVPLVAITTPDPAATIKAVVESLNGSGGPVLQWDVVEGLRALNEEAKAVRATVVGENDTTVGNPVEALRVMRKLPPRSVLFLHLANRWVADPVTIQAAWNLRDELKRDQRMLVLLAIGCEWPAELAGDLVVLDEPLPDAAALEGIVRRIHADAGAKLPDEILPRAVSASRSSGNRTGRCGCC